MTTGPDAHKYVQAAAIVRAQIKDGTLSPGQPAPSGAKLARLTGFSELTCRKALRLLIREGTLTPGPSRNARPRVTVPPGSGPGNAARALSAALAATRRAHGLTQPNLAALTGFSVTAIGHAETGRLWQSRQFWEKTDLALGAAGKLTRLYDACQAENTRRAENPDAPDEREESGKQDEPEEPEVVAPQAPAGFPVLTRVTLHWLDGTTTTAYLSILPAWLHGLVADR